MNSDDPRHGTNAGYVAGCRTCCWPAKQRYDKRRRWEALQGRVRKVSSLGSVRRVRALRANGWAVPTLGQRTSVSAKQLYDIARFPSVYVATHLAIADLYETLAHQSPPQATTAERHAATKAARTATRNGWAGPERWLNIDDPEERPDVGYRPSRPSDEYDEIVVIRAMSGDFSARASRVEKVEIVRRWAAGGRTLRSLEELSGWNVNRYARSEAA